MSLKYDDALEWAAEFWKVGDPFRTGKEAITLDDLMAFAKWIEEKMAAGLAVAVVTRNASGGISLRTPDGEAFDASEHVGARMYLLPSKGTLQDFAESMLDPERNGYSVSAHVRDQARVALGRPRVETLHGRGRHDSQTR